MAYLGVQSSLSGRRWIGPSIDQQRLADEIAQRTEAHIAVSTVLARLGVTPENTEHYLKPQLRDLLPDPRTLIDMERAATRINKATRSKEKVAIFADYDVDGATSATQLVNWFRYFGIEPTVYIPDRIDEGYGPNISAMQMLCTKNDLIICVDCGTLSHEPIAATHGHADVIVLDHHLGGETLPKCFAIVNPNRQDETGELAHLCAAGVVFLTLVECRRLLRDAGQNQLPDLMSLLDLVALGTVADVAPLIGVNRAFVRQGLSVMARRDRLGMRVLSDVVRLDRAPTAYHLGFIFGPRINAGGRIGQADLGLKLLCATSEQEALAIADKLEQLNKDRRELETHIQALAFEQTQERGLDVPLIWAAGDGWHPGVVGIVASRMKEATNRPSIVIGFDGDIGKGSGRSVSGIDLGAAIQKLAHEGLIEKGGGHKMAAGLSLSKNQLTPAMARLTEIMQAQGADQLGPKDVRIDGLIFPQAANTDLIEQLEKCGPFGANAPAPRFAICDAKITFAKRVGQNHLKISFSDDTNTRIDGICFGAYDTPIGQELENNGGKRVHLVGKLDLNIWQGRQSIQFIIEDAAWAE